MKVRELIADLEDQDPEAEVRFMAQPSWPFEYSIAGVCARRDFTEGLDAEPCPAYESEDGPGCQDEDCEFTHGPTEGYDPDKPADTIFLLEGQQLCYGSKKAWEC